MLAQTMDVAKDVMDKETDPSKRGFLEGCIWDFEDVIPKFPELMEAYKNQDEGVLTEIEELFNLIIKVNNKITTGVDDDSVSQNYLVNLSALALTDLGDDTRLLEDEDAYDFGAGETHLEGHHHEDV